MASDSDNETIIDSGKIKALIKKRGVVKGKLTLFKKYLAGLDTQSLSADQLIDIELRITRLTSVFSEFETIQDSIETLSTEVEQQLEERESFESTYFSSVSLAKSYLKKHGERQDGPSRETGNIAGHSESIKYPDIKLPSFCGDVTNWIEFRDTFDALINQSTLKPIQKFQYLRSSLSGSALEVISSLEFSEESYDIAWQLLCERFNNPKVLINNHLKALFHINAVPCNAMALRELADNISKHMRTLSTFKDISTEGWDLLVIFFLTSKLEESLKRKWEEKNNTRQLPTLQDFKSFLRAQADLQDSLSHTRTEHIEPCPNSRKALVTTSSPLPSNSKVTPKPTGAFRSLCPNCKESHYINQCPRFLALDVMSRIRAIKRLGLCLNCLCSNHTLPNCRASTCRTCKGKHHTLLHIPTNTSRQSTMYGAETPNQQSSFITNHQPTNSVTKQLPTNLVTNQQSATLVTKQAGDIISNQTDSHSPTHSKYVLLSTAQVNVVDSNNQTHTLRALLDSGSQSNYLSQKACQLLHLPTQPIDMKVVGFNENITKINQLCNLTIQSKDKTYETELSCFVAPTIHMLPPASDKSMLQHLKIPPRYKLADDLFHEGGDIDMIIGAEFFYQLLCIGQVRLGEGFPILQRTRLGWVVSGAISSPNQPQHVACNLVANSLRNLWGASEGQQSTLLPNDEDTYQSEKIFATHTRTSNGNFEVSIPLKEPKTCLGESRPAVYKRFMTLESKFERDPEYKRKYVDFMTEFKVSGHMIEVNPTESYNYLPHHAVINLEKTTTPLRVVIDASYKTSTGKSLNDIQYKGGLNQDDLINILLRFRKYRYIVNADIEKMYRMIFIKPDQQNLQCVLWRENPTEPLLTYKLTTLSFGLKCAPYIATRCLVQLAHENKEEFPNAAAAIIRDFYMDDLLHGGDDEQSVAETAAQIDGILRQANFKLRKWKSNSATVLNTVNTNLPMQPSTKPISIGPNDTHKVLGLAWNCHRDELSYNLKREAVPKQLTKRKILSVASAIFDPLGLLGPIIIIAKCFIQKLWKMKTDWDKPLPSRLYNEWVVFYNKLFSLRTLLIPRHVIANDYVRIELHGYCDSSLTAYGAVIYLRSIDSQGNIIVQLLCSKTRVARQETIPRLELRATLLLATLYTKVNNALNIQFAKKFFWSDSNVALAWIKSKEPNKLQSFIKNRVTEINKLTDSSDWYWVASADNPADLLSRGLDADKLEGCHLWWQGPAWLAKPNTLWPSTELPHTEVEIGLNETQCNLLSSAEPNQFMTNLYQKWSNFNRLVRCFAYILRFIKNLRLKNNKLRGPLSVNELRESTNKLVQFAQAEVYPNEYKLLQNEKPLPKSSNLISMNPFMQNGLIRVGGRLGLSHYDHNKKHPIILPHDHTLSKLIAHSEHVRLMHAGPQLLLSSIRERFWPVHGKKLVNQVVHKCVTCFRAKPTYDSPIMGNLPTTRVNPAPAFLNTCVDYGGPFMVRDRRGRGYKTSKCYIAIFVCLVVKAVHIELVTGLETSAFLSAYRRFISRRGKPREMLSDNGTTFHGANTEIRELYAFLRENSDEFIYSSAEDGITWKFLPAYTPHMGGLHEAAVKACKYHLKRILGQALLTYEEFSTVLTQIEGILNSRPLCPVPNSNNDEITFLSPAHFLIGRTPISMPDYDYTGTPSNRLTHYQQLQQLQQDFWRRWSRDYIGLLQERTKWRSSKGPGLQVGTVVLVKEAQLPPCRWRLGRIVGCCQGRDGVTRVAEILTNRGLIKRAFNNLCPLPIENID